MLLQSRAKTNKLIEIDLHELLEEYFKLSYLGVRAQNPDFNATIEKLFNASQSNVKVFAEDIGRVFLNLFNNSFYELMKKKLLLGDAFSPYLWVKTEVDGEQFEIRIKDNGSGIPKEIAERLFTPFFTTKPSGQGTGLGLSLSRNIVEKDHGGKMTFETKEGEYTEFIIRLPLLRNG